MSKGSIKRKNSLSITEATALSGVSRGTVYYGIQTKNSCKSDGVISFNIFCGVGALSQIIRGAFVMS